MMNFWDNLSESLKSDDSRGRRVRRVVWRRHDKSRYEGDIKKL